VLVKFQKRCRPNSKDDEHISRLDVEHDQVHRIVKQITG
jgi:hypothetical protein